MNVAIKSILLGTVAFLCTIPLLVSANVHSGAYTEVRLDKKTVLFTVTYRLNVLNRDIYIPLRAVEGERGNDFQMSLNYVLRGENGERVENIEQYAVVLSRANIEDGAYRIPQGTPEHFMFVVLAKIPKEKQGISLDVSSVAYITQGDAGRSYGVFDRDLLSRYRVK